MVSAMARPLGLPNRRQKHRLRRNGSHERAEKTLRQAGFSLKICWPFLLADGKGRKLFVLFNNFILILTDAAQGAASAIHVEPRCAADEPARSPLPKAFSARDRIWKRTPIICNSLR